jgi:hypothetical protein
MVTDIGTFGANSDATATRQNWVVDTLVFVAAGLYSIFAESMPEPIQVAIAGIVSLWLIFAACLPIVRQGLVYLDIRSFALILSICSMLMTYIFLVSINTPLNDYALTILRVMTGISALVYFMRYEGSILAGAKIAIYVTVSIVAVATTALYGLYDYAGVLRPYPFAGVDAIHSSAYIVSGALIGVVLMRLRQEIGSFTAWLVGLPLFGLFIAYQVRTTWVMVLVFFMILLVQAIRRRTTHRLFASAVGLGGAGSVLLLLTLIFFFIPNFDLVEFSSGRTSTYAERFSMLAERSSSQWLFGTGLGSDMFFSTSWWWEAKDSHNDFLNVVIEQGLVGLFVILLTFGWSLRHANNLQAAVLVAFISGSAISNALLVRPMLAVLFLAAIVPSPSSKVAQQDSSFDRPASRRL